jgi:hypothetical protein
MNAQELLQEISDYCRQTGLAESTFGRRAVNDGKLASRLRHGGRITTETLDRIRASWRRTATPPAPAVSRGRSMRHACRNPSTPRPMAPPQHAPSIPHSRRPATAGNGADPQRNFRFFDNRQKYLLFVNTCCEKWVVANRVSLELHNIHPRPPALALFDAGVGDGTCCGGDALDARPLPAHAVLRRRQGDQPRGTCGDADAEECRTASLSTRRPCLC